MDTSERCNYEYSITLSSPPTMGRYGSNSSGLGLIHYLNLQSLKEPKYSLQKSNIYNIKFRIQQQKIPHTGDKESLDL